MREKRQQRPDDDDDRPKWKKRRRKRDLFRSEKGGREASFRLPPILLLLPRRNDKQRRRKKKAFSPLLFRRGEPKAVVGRTGETKRGEGEWSGAAAASISPSLYHTIIHFHSGGIRRRQQFLVAAPSVVAAVASGGARVRFRSWGGEPTTFLGGCQPKEEKNPLWGVLLGWKEGGREGS